jgi:hypothetical protein
MALRLLFILESLPHRILNDDFGILVIVSVSLVDLNIDSDQPNVSF